MKVSQFTEQQQSSLAGSGPARRNDGEYAAN